MRLNQKKVSKTDESDCKETKSDKVNEKDEVNGILSDSETKPKTPLRRVKRKEERRRGKKVKGSEEPKTTPKKRNYEDSTPRRRHKDNYDNEDGFIDDVEYIEARKLRDEKLQAKKEKQKSSDKENDEQNTEENAARALRPKKRAWEKENDQTEDEITLNKKKAMDKLIALRKQKLGNADKSNEDEFRVSESKETHKRLKRLRNDVEESRLYKKQRTKESAVSLELAPELDIDSGLDLVDNSVSNTEYVRTGLIIDD